MGYGTTSDGVNYWLAKNSWGADYGDKGYIRFERSGEGDVGIFGEMQYSYKGVI